MARRGEVTRADVLPSEFVTLAEHLQAGGLRTGAIVANPWLRSSFGFAQGFEHYNDSMASWDAPGRAVNRAALAWLQQLGEGERFFLYLHYLDTHRPYGRLTREDLSIEVPPGDTREMNEEAVTEFHKFIALADGTPFKDAGAVPSAALVERAYDRGVENFDAILGSLLDRLSQHPAWPKMAVIVTSDHGESLYERGYGNHGGSLFDDETAVPLVARLPGVVPETGRVDCLVSLLDLMPSLCAYLGVDCGDDLQGWNLFAAPPSHPRLLVSEGVMTRPRNRSARGERWKLLYEPDGRRDGRTWASSWSLYDMKGDPAEQRDRLAGRPDAEAKQIFARLKQGLLAAVTEKQVPERRTAPVDPEMEKRLRALGYLEE
jgi:arylsulfatase A-like enzyme